MYPLGIELDMKYFICLFLHFEYPIHAYFKRSYT